MAEHNLAHPSKTHLMSSKVVLHCQTGPLEALAWDQPARTRLCSQSSPTTEGALGSCHLAPAASAWQSKGPLSSWALCSAQQHFSQCHWQGHAGVPGGSPIPLLAKRHHRPFIPPTPAHSTSNTSLALQLSQRAAILTSASLSRLLALGILHWVKDKEWKKGSSDASAAWLGEQSSGTQSRAETLHGRGSPPSPS